MAPLRWLALFWRHGRVAVRVLFHIDIHMKAIQVRMDEELIEKLDRLEEVHLKGRSAVLRDIVREFLARRREEQIERQYRDAYAKNPPDEFKDSDARDWPED